MCNSYTFSIFHIGEMLLTLVCEGCPEDRTQTPFPLHNPESFYYIRNNNKHIKMM